MNSIFTVQSSAFYKGGRDSQMAVSNAIGYNVEKAIDPLLLKALR